LVFHHNVFDGWSLEVLLQELDDGAKASDYQNQLKLLQERVADLYPCSTSAFDWKADFVPDRHIFGSVGRQLSTLSRYRLEHAERLQLPIAEANFINTGQFALASVTAAFDQRQIGRLPGRKTTLEHIDLLETGLFQRLGGSG
jgi:hypothetical protein